ncbi:hypothetical protein Tco_0527007 [Tanacetum coccineum]
MICNANAQYSLKSAGGRRLFVIRCLVNKLENYREQIQGSESRNKAIVAKTMILDKQKAQAPANRKRGRAKFDVTEESSRLIKTVQPLMCQFYQDNVITIKSYVSQALAANVNQGNSNSKPPMVSNQIRPPGFPPVQNNQNRFNPNQGNNFNQNRGTNFNQNRGNEPFSGITTNYFDALPPSSSPVKTSDNLEEFANELTLLKKSSLSVPSPEVDIDEIDAYLFMEVLLILRRVYYDSEGDVIFLENLLSDDTTHNLAPKVISDHEPKQNESSITFSPRSDPLPMDFAGDF